jgi:predicted PurR-regulated permease PerM
MRPNRISTIVLVSLACVAALLCLMIIRPFFKPIVFALVLVILFYPVHSRIPRALPYRNAGALVSTLLVMLFIGVAVFGLGSMLASELRGVYEFLAQPANSKAGQSAAGSGYMEKLLRWADHYLAFPGLGLEAGIRDEVGKLSGYLLGLIAGTLKQITSIVAEALASFFILFFLFRDGRRVKKRIISLLPSPDGRFERLFGHVNDTVIATVYGSLAIAAIQGLLVGVALWAVGLHSPVLWAAVTAVCALIPVIGTGIVWIPAVAFLMFTGHIGKAIALAIWCSVVVHPVDNILKPYLISGRIRELNTLYLFVALLGGLEVFGFLGLFVGPVVLSVTSALFKMLGEEMNAWMAPVQSGGSPGDAMPTAGRKCNSASRQTLSSLSREL